MLQAERLLQLPRDLRVGLQRAAKLHRVVGRMWLALAVRLRWNVYEVFLLNEPAS